MRDIKFRAWIAERREFAVVVEVYHDGSWGYSYKEWSEPLQQVVEIGSLPRDRDCLDQFTGLHDKNGKEIYLGDIGRFDNGDTFVIKMEEWLQPFVEWIGDPECEDQVRDLYRIERAEIIGNIHKNLDLLKESK